MDSRLALKIRMLLLGLIAILLAVLSALHGGLLAMQFNYDINQGLGVIGAATFVSALLITLPKNKLVLLCALFLVPLLFGISFSWAELLSEFDPRNGSKGFGYLWLIFSCICSFTGFAAGLLLKWILSKIRRTTET